MPRPKEFDREVVMEIARGVFWRQGYQATSTEDLRLAMGIGRQSFYDSFGGKRQLYLEVLRRYNSDGIEACIATLPAAPSPLAAVSALLLLYSKETPRRRARGCPPALCDHPWLESDVEGRCEPGGASRRRPHHSRGNGRTAGGEGQGSAGLLMKCSLVGKRPRAVDSRQRCPE